MVEVIAILNQEDSMIADAFLKNVIARHEVPQELYSDQERNFISEIWKELFNLLDIKRARKTPLHHQSDRMVNSHNRVISNSFFWISNQTGSCWVNPIYVIADRNMKLSIDLMFGSPTHDNENEPSFLEYVNELMKCLRKENMILRDLSTSKEKRAM